MSTHTPLRLPESMTRVDIGPYIKGLREHYGLSQQDVSERLHIRHRYINAIEHGALDQMPGRAYAKGYVHTYAEFLGLDPEQVVEICFGAEPVREQQKHFVPAPAKRGGGMGGQWRSIAVLAIVVALGVLAIGQFTAGDDAASSDTVAEVPEDLLDEMRHMVMPTASNYQCLYHGVPLACLQEGAPWKLLQQLLAVRHTNFAEKTYAGPLPDAKKPGAEKTEAKKPASDAKKAAAKKPASKPSDADDADKAADAE